MGALTALLATPLALVALAPGPAEPADPAPVSHPVTLPGDAPATVRLERTVPGSTFHLALWYVGAGDSVGEGVRITVGTTPDDTGCGSGAVFRPTLGETAPLLTASASTWTDEPEHPCAVAARLYAGVGVPSDPADRGRPATLLVYEEPPLPAYSFGLLREPVLPDWAPPAPRPSSRPVAVGTTPADAPLVAAGSHPLTLRPGGRAVVRVPLDWDQSLRAQVDGSPEATVTILGPLLGEDVASSAPGRAQSHVVSYLHRDSFDPTRSGASLAGERYVLVDLPPRARPAEVTLRLAVDGSPGDGVPDYATAPHADAPDATDGREDGGLSAPVWVGAGALVVLGAVALTRRGARARGR